MHLSNITRGLLLVLLAAAGFTLGYMRWTFVILWDNGFHLGLRSVLYAQYPYPSNLHELSISLSRDPRWLSFIFYSIAPFMLSLATVWIVFQRKQYIKNTLMIYLFAWSLVAILSLTGLLIHSYSGGIGLAQNIKHLLQTPFFTVLLLALFYAHEKVKPSDE